MRRSEPVPRTSHSLRRNRRLPENLPDRIPRRERLANPMSSELLPGAHCGDYELLAHIGQGGMAQVWSARSLSTGELVAIKTLLPAYRENAVLKERLSREGQSQNFLHHPNILRSLGTFEWSGSIFMVMDLVDGESLEKYIHRRRIMPVPEVRGGAQAVLSALTHA